MPPGYLQGAAEKVRAAGGLVIIDEVQSGFGKTGDAMWCFDHHDIVPDMMIIAKGLGNGLPIGALITKKEIAESMAGKFLFHTYGANPVSCAAARAVLQVIKEEDMISNVKKVGAKLHEGLQQIKDRYEIIGDVRGRGFMQAIELVKDQVTKEPAPEHTAHVFESTREHGLILSKSGAFKNCLRMVPPLCLEESDVQAVLDAFDRSFADLESANLG